MNARQAALLVMRKVEREGAYANIALNQTLRENVLSPQDARLAAQIAYGAIRMQNALDYILQRFLSKPLEQLPDYILPVLRLSLYQLLYLDKIPPSAAVNEGVTLAKKYGGQKIGNLVNAVLRQAQRQGGLALLPRREEDFVEYLTVTLSHPRWLVQRLTRLWPAEEAEAFCRCDNANHQVAIRCNTLRISREELFRRLQEAGIEGEASPYAPESVVIRDGSAAALQSLRQEGLFAVQGEASALVAHALAPRPQMQVLDMCAAPGGKSTHMAALMQNRGRICACDIRPHKLKLIEDAAALLGITIVQPVLADALRIDGRVLGMADGALLDAPCSGLGVLAARADARWRKREEDIPRLAEQGLAMLFSVADQVRPGGRLCFSTCTVTDEENIENVRKFLARREDFRLTPIWGLRRMFHDPQDLRSLEQGYIQLLPHKHHTDGFFIALLQRNDHA
ncbi:MAG: 16S rRNA (cytosine(967)-C(5))-methyltransferase RsmB [Firmicutes bacterium]|nr:16S rRNA (cytosine(967)-C(5))-methyltransferase RsmB [Bacillota bacterium]